ncbi:MAG: hypothetical protein DMG14_03035 [Acidobacteria bacterium]|nr:MAG: hypothetical protein DMG14_03035 [Acidobacteriota bacterium]
MNSANDARIEIEEASSAPPGATPPAVVLARKPWVSWIVASVPAIAFASIAVAHFREKAVAEAPEMRLEINAPSTSVPLEFALSPDGRNIVFVASGDGPQRL